MSDADLEEDLEFSGRARVVMGAVSVGVARAFVTAAGFLFLFGAAALASYLLGWTSIERANRPALVPVFVGVLVAGLVLVAIGRWLDADWGWRFPLVCVVGFAGGIVLITLAQIYIGPTLNIAVYFVEVPILAFVVLRPRWAVATTVATLAGFALALAVIGDSPSPAQQILNLCTSAAATGFFIGGIATRLDASRRAERRAKTTLDDLNGRLRRFLAPQVFDVIDVESALAPHRREIAVFFVDLRGFTAFTNAVSAERVIAVLEEYYTEVGTVLDRFDATIGGFDGDGIFAYLGDPRPHDNAASEVVVMAAEVARSLDVLTTRWSDDAASLGYGIGLAFGEATLGLVGFANRADYTPVGAVVNLAARLCSEAKHGEILIDVAVREAAGVPDSDCVAVDLKGFGTVAAYTVAH